MSTVSRVEQMKRIQNNARLRYELINKDYFKLFEKQPIAQVLNHVGDLIRSEIDTTEIFKIQLKAGTTIISDYLMDLHNCCALAFILKFKTLSEIELTDIKRIQDEGCALFEKKNHDYGDSFATYGLIGVLVRIGDKLKRIQTLCDDEETAVADESIQDTIIDMMNYSAMALMLISFG
jgi:hypothetical protein